MDGEVNGMNTETDGGSLALETGLRQLKDGLEDSASPEKIEQEVLSLLASMVREEEDLCSQLAELSVKWAETGTCPPLLDIALLCYDSPEPLRRATRTLIRRKVPEEQWGELGRIIYYYGVYSSSIPEEAGAADRDELERRLDSFPSELSDLRALESMLAEIELLNRFYLERLVGAAAERKSVEMLLFLRLMAEYPSREVALQAIDGMSGIDDPGAILALERTLNHREGLAAEIIRSVRKLEFKQVSSPSPPTSQSEHRLSGLWSMPEGYRRSYLLLESSAEERLGAVGLTLDPGLGIVGCELLPLDGEHSLEDRRSSLASRADCVTLEQDFALGLLEDALAASAESGEPLPQAVVLAAETLGVAQPKQKKLDFHHCFSQLGIGTGSTSNEQEEAATDFVWWCDTPAATEEVVRLLAGGADVESIPDGDEGRRLREIASKELVRVLGYKALHLLLGSPEQRRAASFVTVLREFRDSERPAELLLSKGVAMLTFRQIAERLAIGVEADRSY